MARFFVFDTLSCFWSPQPHKKAALKSHVSRQEQQQQQAVVVVVVITPKPKSIPSMVSSFFFFLVFFLLGKEGDAFVVPPLSSSTVRQSYSLSFSGFQTTTTTTTPTQRKSDPLLLLRQTTYQSSTRLQLSQDDEASRPTGPRPTQQQRPPKQQQQQQRPQQQRPQQQQQQRRPYQQSLNQNNNNNNRNPNHNHNSQNNPKPQRPTISGVISPPANKQLNQAIVTCETAQDVLQLLASTEGALTSVGGAGRMNSVNFSTALHRIAKHVVYQNNNNNNNNNNKRDGGGGGPTDNSSDDNNTMMMMMMMNKNNRSRILSDARFAFLVCSASEALSGDTKMVDAANRPMDFRSRELCNMVWALTKLKLVPPQSVLPIELTAASASTKLLLQAAKVRTLVYDVARTRASGGVGGQSQSQSQSQHSASTWIPALSELCGMIQDAVSYQVLQSATTAAPTNTNTNTNTNAYSKLQQNFQLQEYSNLLWALATSQRADATVVQFIITSLLQEMKHTSMTATTTRRPLPVEGGGVSSTIATGAAGAATGARDPTNDSFLLRPQEWANSIWALATSGIVNGPEDDLLPFVAELMSTHPPAVFLDQFKPQELSNTAWGVATILSNKSKLTLTAPSTQAALVILRHVAQQVTQRQALGFKTQELSNTAWAFATLGFGLSGGPLSTDYTILVSETPQEDKETMTRAMRAILKQAKTSIRYFQSQELNNLAWTMARLLNTNNNNHHHHQDNGKEKEEDDNTELMDMIGNQLCDPKRMVSSQVRPPSLRKKAIENDNRTTTKKLHTSGSSRFFSFCSSNLVRFRTRLCLFS
jgi:hypothetical protein